MGLKQLDLTGLDPGGGKAAVAELYSPVVRRQRLLLAAIYQEHSGSSIRGRVVWQDAKRRTSGES